MNDMRFHWAAEYWDRGWSVIPLVGKRPPEGFGWKRYQTVRATLDDIRCWFEPSSEFNIGVLTGSISGIIVVDCDTPEDALWWVETFPSTTLLSFTGRGAHLFYRSNPEAAIGNRAHVLGRKIDIRGDGGLVVAPPSVHPETKKAYQWQPWDYYALDEIPLFDPAWLGPELTRSFAAAPATGSVRHGLAYIGHIEAVSGAGGHDATFRAACKLRDSGLNATDALAALRSWNETNAAPSWTEKELRHKIHDAYERSAS